MPVCVSGMQTEGAKSLGHDSDHPSYSLEPWQLQQVLLATLCKLAAASKGELALQMVLRFASSAPQQIEGLLMACTDPLVRDTLQNAAQQTKEHLSAQTEQALRTAVQLEVELASLERSQSKSQVSLICPLCI